MTELKVVDGGKAAPRPPDLRPILEALEYRVDGLYERLEAEFQAGENSNKIRGDTLRELYQDYVSLECMFEETIDLFHRGNKPIQEEQIEGIKVTVATMEEQVKDGRHNPFDLQWIRGRYVLPRHVYWVYGGGWHGTRWVKRW